jgi:hypothetical protein
MTGQPELDEQDISLLSGESGKEPLGALGAFALRCMHKGWGMPEFAAAAAGSRILESLCTDGNRYRAQRADAKLSGAWRWAEKTFSPTFEIKHQTAPRSPPTTTKEPTPTRRCKAATGTVVADLPKPRPETVKQQPDLKRRA